MKPLSERDENPHTKVTVCGVKLIVGMKPLSERDENFCLLRIIKNNAKNVGMKPLSERDENWSCICFPIVNGIPSRNEATL